jgi:hypothetical protein
MFHTARSGGPAGYSGVNLFGKGKTAPGPEAKAPAFSPIDRVGLLGLLDQIVNGSQSGVLELQEPRGNWTYAFQTGALTHASGGRVRGARQAFDLLWEFQAGQFMFTPGENRSLAGNLYIDKSRLTDLLRRSQAVLQGPSAPYIPPDQQRPVAPVPRPYAPPSPAQMPPAWQPGMQQPGWPQAQPGMMPPQPGMMPVQPGMMPPGMPQQAWAQGYPQPYPGAAPQPFPGAQMPQGYPGAPPQAFPGQVPAPPAPPAPLPPQAYPPVRGKIRPQVPPAAAAPAYPPFPPQPVAPPQPIMPQAPAQSVAPPAPARPAAPPSFSVPPMAIPRKEPAVPMYQPQPAAAPPAPAAAEPPKPAKDDLAALRASLVAQAPAIKPAAPSANWNVRTPSGPIPAVPVATDPKAKGKGKAKEPKKKGDSKMAAGIKVQLIKFLLWACERRYDPDDHWTLKDAFEVSTMELRDQFFGAFSQTFASTKKKGGDIDDDMDDMAAGRMRGRGRRH